MSVLTCERDGHVLTVRQSDPAEGERENADTFLLERELYEIVAEAEKDRDVYVLILSCDTKMCAVSEEALIEKIRNLRVPVIAAIDTEGCPAPGFYDFCIATAESGPQRNCTTQTAAPMAEAQKLAAQICVNGQIAIQEIKKCVDMGSRVGMTEGLEIEQQSFCTCHGTKDKVIGMKAFLDGESEKHFIYE